MPGARANAGFTLIEMMAVMLILAMITSLAIASIPGTGRAGLKAVTLQAVALLRREREGAILKGGDRSVFLDGVRRLLIGEGGDEVAIPRDVVVNILGADDLGSGPLPVVRFHGDGGSSGTVLRFSRETAEYEVRVNWYTGGVSVGAD